MAGNLSFDQVRAKIRKNLPSKRAALHWRKVSESRLESHCGRFMIERHGEGEATRYAAKLKPNTVIGYRLATADQAKQICEQHASPLPLEPGKDREPGSDEE